MHPGGFLEGEQHDAGRGDGRRAGIPAVAELDHNRAVRGEEFGESLGEAGQPPGKLIAGEVAVLLLPYEGERRRGEDQLNATAPGIETR